MNAEATAAEATAAETTERETDGGAPAKRQRTEIGRVSSTSMQRTATVVVERRVKHPVYGKYIRRSKKYHVHDEDNRLKVGDTVQIRECRPISKTKSWTLDKVLSEAAE